MRASIDRPTEEIADTVSSLKFSGDGESAYDMEEESSAPIQSM